MGSGVSTSSDALLVLPIDDTPMIVAAEMYVHATPLAPIPVHGIRADGRCTCGSAKCRVSPDGTYIGKPGKHPVGNDWQKWATRDMDAVRERFRDHTGNIGLYFGVGRYVGIDADSEAAVALVRSWDLPPTLHGQSGSGVGGHWFFEFATHQDPSLVTDRKVCAGVDVKRSGQFVEAPSRHLSGGVYRWIDPLPIASLPDAVYDRIRKPERVRPVSTIAPAPSSSSVAELEKRARKYVAACEPAIQGSDGSTTTFNVARGLWGWVSKGLPESIGWQLLVEYSEGKCQPPWSESELRHKWDSASKAERIPVIEDRPAPFRVIAGGRAASVVAGESSGSLPPNEPPSGGGGGASPGIHWLSELDWMELRNGKPKIKDIVSNVIRILQLEPRWQGRVRFDDFRSRIEVQEAPWDDYQRPSKSLLYWTDEDTTRLQAWLQREFKSYAFSPKRGDCENAIPVVARTHDFNPVREQLESFEWDGNPRLSSWLSVYLGAEQTEYTRLVGTWWLVSAVARVFDPGCKVDTVPILEGRQGLRKSSALRVLAGPEFFNDTPIDIGSKDAYTAIQGCWFVELAELDSLLRAEATRAKAFFSSGKDRFRRAYARHERDELRQCVFIGTTNLDEYLNDPTGGRRFWPIRCDVIDLAALERDRGQLWAEALAEYREGRVWYPTADVEHDMLGDRQESRMQDDSWEAKVEQYLRTCGNEVTKAELLERALRMPEKDWTKAAQVRVGIIMVNRMRWSVRQKRATGSTVKPRFYARPGT